MDNMLHSKIHANNVPVSFENMYQNAPLASANMHQNAPIYRVYMKIIIVFEAK